MAKNKDKYDQHKEYSKLLLIQESALIWVVTIGMMFIALLCIVLGFTGSLPWLAAMVAFPWTAYGVSQAFYYKKSIKENTEGGIKFESIMAEVKATYGEAAQKIDWTAQLQEPMMNIGNDPIEESSKPINLDYGI